MNSRYTSIIKDKEGSQLIIHKIDIDVRCYEIEIALMCKKLEDNRASKTTL